MNKSEFYYAITEEQVDGYTGYPLYFINNSQSPIDELLILRPGKFNLINPTTKIGDISESLIDNNGIHKYIDVPPKSFIQEDLFRDWDFDFSNERKVILKIGSKEEHFHYYMGKGFIVFADDEDIPILNKKGWMIKDNRS
jgi:hypothetical protein